MLPLGRGYSRGHKWGTIGVIPRPYLWAWAYTAFSDQYPTPRDGQRRAASAFTLIAASHRGSGGR